MKNTEHKFNLKKFWAKSAWSKLSVICLFPIFLLFMLVQFLLSLDVSFKLKSYIFTGLIIFFLLLAAIFSDDTDSTYCPNSKNYEGEFNACRSQLETVIKEKDRCLESNKFEDKAQNLKVDSDDSNAKPVENQAEKNDQKQNDEENAEEQQPQKESNNPYVFIPGANRIDVTKNLEDRDFTCEVETDSDGLKTWYCEDDAANHNYVVEIYGKSSSEILSVVATASNFSIADTNELVDDFLGYIASLPYDNAQRSEARQWVKDSLSKVNEDGDEDISKVFSNVKYTVSGESRLRMLEIEHEDFSWDDLL